MGTDKIFLRHIRGFDKEFHPRYVRYTAEKTVVFPVFAATEKGEHKSRFVVYFFPRISRLTGENGNKISFSEAGFAPGDKISTAGEGDEFGTILKITPFLAGSDRVEHYRLECRS